MENHITSEDVASQFAKSIQLLLEWAKQEMPAVHQPEKTKAKFDQEIIGDLLTQIPNRLLKAKEVADTLQVSRSQVYKMMQLGDIPTVRVGTAVRVRPSDLEEFIKKVK